MRKCKVILITIVLIAIESIRYNGVFGVETMLRVAFEPNLPPYQFLEDGKPVGMHIDILNSIAKKNNFKIEYVPIENESKCLDALNTGSVDIVLGLVADAYSKYKDQFTERISQSSICVVARKKDSQNIKDNMNEGHFTATYEYNTMNYAYVLNMNNIRSLIVANQIDAFNNLLMGRADMLVGVRGSIVYQLEKAELDEQYTIINNYMVPVEYTMAVKKGDKELLNKLNASLRKMRLDGEYSIINDKWANEENYAVKEIIRRVAVIAFTALVVVLVVILFNLRLNIVLKRQVSKKTQELQNINGDLEKQVIQTRNSNELRNKIVESSPSGIIVFDKECMITLTNKSALCLLGSESEITGKSVFDFELLKKILEDKIYDIFSKEQKYLNIEINYKGSNGRDSVFRYDIYQLYDYKNNIRGAILSLYDISEEKRLKDQIYEKEKNTSLNRIIAGIAHEVRNPLTSIKTFIEMIPYNKNDEQFQNELTEIVPKEIDRVSGLIKNLMDYAKPDSKNKEATVVKDIVESCAVLMNHMLEKEQVSLNVVIEEGLVVLVDKNQLKQVLINIIINSLDSIKSLEHKTGKLSIRIDAWKDSDYIYIQIMDEGCGMSEDEIKNATEPFYTTKSTGTGLGLYITKQYIEENEGTLKIESEKGVYTKVTLKFRRIE